MSERTQIAAVLVVHAPGTRVSYGPTSLVTHASGPYAAEILNPELRVVTPSPKGSTGLYVWTGEVEVKFSGPVFVGEWRRMTAAEAVIFARGADPLTTKLEKAS